MSQPDIDLDEFMRALNPGRRRIDQLSEPEARALSSRPGMDSDAQRALFDDRLGRERNTPNPGGPTPDFNLELLDR
jgi:hypothetical protein